MLTSLIADVFHVIFSPTASIFRYAILPPLITPLFFFYYADADISPFSMLMPCHFTPLPPCLILFFITLLAAIITTLMPDNTYAAFIFMLIIFALQFSCHYCYCHFALILRCFSSFDDFIFAFAIISFADFFHYFLFAFISIIFDYFHC